MNHLPHNLPRQSEFMGREEEKKRIYEALSSRYHLVSIDGIGGIGKSSLALEVVYECLQASYAVDRPDGKTTFAGFIWTTAKDRDLTLNALLDTTAQTLDYPGITQHPLEEKRFAVRRLLQDQEKPYLLIVDNFETITDTTVWDFLVHLPDPAKAIITTREQKWSKVWAISLKGLTEQEALALIRVEGRRLGLKNLEQGDDQTLLNLYQATGAFRWRSNGR
ncbi:MAG: ATP-binding protein [Anaerolineae bacterium]|nr:ATP-binding protein [Anaerolineae bacterium]